MAANLGPKIIRTGLVLDLDAADQNSYIGSGTSWYDSSGNNNKGTLINGPTFNSGNGGSIVFNGSTQYVDITNTASTFGFANTTFTVNIWFKQSTLSTGALISKDGSNSGWSIWTVNDGTVVPFLKNGSTVDAYQKQTSVIIKTNTWTNVTCIITTSTTVTANNNIVIYANGVLNTGTVTSVTTYGSDSSFNIYLGRRGTSPYLNGNIAIAQIYNRGLTATEVLQNYNATKSRFGL